MGDTPSTELVLSTQNAAATEFTNFGNLPKEIRLLIWEAAVDNIDPRFVLFHANVHGDEPDHPRPRRDCGYLASWMTPSILHVNSEARTVALKAYPLFANMGVPSRILNFNVNCDSVILGDPSIERASDDLALVKFVDARWAVYTRGARTLIQDPYCLSGLERGPA
jgi:2EXR family